MGIEYYISCPSENLAELKSIFEMLVASLVCSFQSNLSFVFRSFVFGGCLRYSSGADSDG